MGKIDVVINSILDGQASSQYFGTRNSYNTSIAIDPDFPDPGSAVKTSSYAVPVGYSVFSGANVTASTVAIITNPKNTLTYVVLSNGRLISYSSSLGSETLIGTVTGNTATGAFYYNNYIYIMGTSTGTDVARYGPLNNSPSLTNGVWTGSTLGSNAALTNTTYPALRGVTLPNHWGMAHVDGSAYFLDFLNGQGMVHRINTKKVTNEGDTNGTVIPSAYNVLDLPFGYYPVDICSYGLDVAILAFQTVDTTILQGNAALFLWNTTADTFYAQVDISDPLATAMMNINGVLFIWTGNANNGVRLSRYAGGTTVAEVLYQEEGTPPFQGAVDTRGNRIVWGGWTSYPAASASVFAVNSKAARLSPNPPPLHNIAKSTAVGTTPVVTALKYVQQSSNIKPNVVIASTDGSGSYVDKYNATGALTSVLRFMFNVGKRFQLTYLRIPLAGAIGANTSITTKVLLDDVTTTKTLTVANNTTMSGRRKIIYKLPDLQTLTEGDNNFMIEFTWGGTDPMPIGFPIRLSIDTIDDEF